MKGCFGKAFSSSRRPQQTSNRELEIYLLFILREHLCTLTTKIKRDKDNVLCFLKKIRNKRTHLRANMCCVPMWNWKQNGEILMLYIGYLGWKALIPKVTSLMKSRQFYNLVASTVGTTPEKQGSNFNFLIIIYRASMYNPPSSVFVIQVAERYHAVALWQNTCRVIYPALPCIHRRGFQLNVTRYMQFGHG